MLAFRSESIWVRFNAVIVPLK